MHKHSDFCVFFLHYIFFCQKPICATCAFILATRRQYIIQEWKNTELCDVSGYAYPVFHPLYILIQDFPKPCSHKLFLLPHCRGPAVSLLGAYISSYLMDQSDLQQYSLNQQPEKRHTCSAGELPVNRCSAMHFSDTEHGHSATYSLSSQVKQVLSTRLTAITNRCELQSYRHKCHDFYYH